MPADTAQIPLASITLLFLALLVIGLLLTLPLFRFKYTTFVRSNLFIKIMWWVPIFIIFVGFLYMSNFLRLILLVLLLGMSLREIIRALHRKRAAQTLLISYFVVFGTALLHVYAIARVYPAQAVSVLVTLGFASVLADVTAFFMGNYLGKHKLPDALNARKSWEGVLGQIIGAALGVALVHNFVMGVTSVWLFLPIGIGAAIGDLANSYVKRRINSKDWSQAIPGHGGYVDRLCSLAGSAICTFYFLKFVTPG